MFVLKALIDKYTNEPSDKLFTCFVDFLKKVFDWVIHPGMKMKLRDLNIDGKFYYIISKMYSKTNLCVRLGDSRTKVFKSNIGVRQGDVLSPNILFLLLMISYHIYWDA